MKVEDETVQDKSKEDVSGKRGSCCVARWSSPGAGRRTNTVTKRSGCFCCSPTPDQIRRMRWWHEAKFGMFIHFGLYSDHARHEWAMETEAIPFSEYTPLAKTFNPAPGCARDWAKLAKTAGMEVHGYDDQAS